jgi:arginase
MKKIKIYEVKSEIGAGTRGASLGSEAIKIAALDFGSTFFKKNRTIEIPNENRLLMEPDKHFDAKRINGLHKMFTKITAELVPVLKNDKVFPIVLGGDHSTAAATITAIKMAHPKKRLGVIWIDAHADIHSPYTTPSGNMHGMPISIVLGEDNAEKKINKLDDYTIAWWEKLKDFGGISPKIQYQDLVYVAVRDTEPQEDYLIKRHKIKSYSVTELRKKGVDRIAHEILNQLEDCDLIYISFDIDCLDPAISKGTGTRAPGGLDEREAGNLLLRLVRDSKVCCFEMVEINPTLDDENRTAEHAFEILSKVTNQITHEL